MYVGQELFGLLTEHHPDGNSKEHSTVADIAEHDTEEEGEDRDSIEGRVDFLVPRHTISVDDLLERHGELIHFEVSGRLTITFSFPQAHKGGH